MRPVRDRVPLLGAAIDRLDLEGAVRACEARLADTPARGGAVCFVNVHTLTESVSDPRLSATFDSAVLLLADGMPLVWASRAKGQPIGGRVSGPDFMVTFLERHRDLPQGFLGGKPGVAEAMADKLGVQKAICVSTPIRPFSEENVRDDWQAFLRACGDGPMPRVVWVGLGAPKQELWMHVAARLSPQTLFFGVGAAFDFHGGQLSRAPLWMQNAGLEWFYRLAQEPRRLWRRYLFGNTKFIVLQAYDLATFGLRRVVK